MLHGLGGDDDITDRKTTRKCSGRTSTNDHTPIACIDQMLRLNSELRLAKAAVGDCYLQYWKVCDRQLSHDEGLGLVALLKARLHKGIAFLLRRNNRKYLHAGGTRPVAKIAATSNQMPRSVANAATSLWCSTLNRSRSGGASWDSGPRNPLPQANSHHSPAVAK